MKIEIPMNVKGTPEMVKYVERELAKLEKRFRAGLRVQEKEISRLREENENLRQLLKEGGETPPLRTRTHEERWEEDPLTLSSPPDPRRDGGEGGEEEQNE